VPEALVLRVHFHRSSQMVCDRFRERWHASCEDEGVELENRASAPQGEGNKSGIAVYGQRCCRVWTTMMALPRRRSCGAGAWFMDPLLVLVGGT
jgi:hypothetical protein